MTLPGLERILIGGLWLRPVRCPVPEYKDCLNGAAWWQKNLCDHISPPQYVQPAEWRWSLTWQQPLHCEEYSWSSTVLLAPTESMSVSGQWRRREESWPVWQCDSLSGLGSKPMELARWFCSGLYQPENFQHSLCSKCSCVHPVHLHLGQHAAGHGHPH